MGTMTGFPGEGREGAVRRSDIAMKGNILLVEDDRLSRESLAFLLQREGYAVTAVGSAEEASQRLYGRCPNIAVLDIRLPGQRGDDFAEMLQHRCPRTRLVFVSGECQIDPLARFGPAACFFAKPLDLDSLLRTLGTAW